MVERKLKESDKNRLQQECIILMPCFSDSNKTVVSINERKSGFVF